MADSVKTHHLGGVVLDVLTCARRWRGSDECGSSWQRKRWKKWDVLLLLIQARELIVPDVAIVFKAIGLSFSYDGMDQSADVGFVRSTQQSNSGLDPNMR